MKGEGRLDHSLVTTWLKKFHSGCLNLDNQATSGGAKTVDSEAMPQVMEVSNNRKVLSELSISQSSMVHHFQKHLELANE